MRRPPRRPGCRASTNATLPVADRDRRTSLCTGTTNAEVTSGELVGTGLNTGCTIPPRISLSRSLVASPEAGVAVPVSQSFSNCDPAADKRIRRNGEPPISAVPLEPRRTLESSSNRTCCIDTPLTLTPGDSHGTKDRTRSNRCRRSARRRRTARRGDLHRRHVRRLLEQRYCHA